MLKYTIRFSSTILQNTSEVALFIREFVLGIPSTTYKKNAAYFTVTSDIQAFHNTLIRMFYVDDTTTDLYKVGQMFVQKSSSCVMLDKRCLDMSS